MMAVSSQWPMSLSVTLLTSAGLLSLSSVIEAAPRFHDDRPNLSTSAIIQTLGNVFRLPEILGGRINADSDVRFGLASAPEDPLVDVVERFEPSGSRGARLFNDEEYGDIAGPSPTRFAEDYGDGFKRIRHHPRDSLERRDFLGFSDHQGRSDDVPSVPPRMKQINRKTQKLKGVDDGPIDKTDFIGLTRHTFSPGKN
ncbi:uncharacterized protein LOC111266074 isoform X1 [Varroa jacobsoni]|uniref:Uncharacterized protein n=1 Tax=Varroa destructor TaxID=109461 RepID=A0A7M7KJD0_VARDE|nr:uncharacterized protein LOC111253085 [Varroa destructor]XP_022667742.1 uncharacterized protein LOC111253085 [Varroa destructor]XP_022667756.1 uncharacterized protein LOC111253085 [Varroa destructor]XP_022698969.1 uncharacterized protein LOC111266074 isoform X1 [Varroa jacobsoni]XP_022698970.1 uncharacterized protein LOC111266074 isoform X1 [Varroa jacobsoni]